MMKKKHKGMILPMYLVIVLIIFTFLSLMFKYSMAFAIVRQVENRIYQAVIDVLAENWDKVYSSVREGYSGAYTYDASGVFNEVYSSSSTQTRINNYLNLTNNQKLDNHGKVLYEIRNISTSISNISFKDSTLDFHVKITADIDVPLELLNTKTMINIPINLRSKYSKKF